MTKNMKIAVAVAAAVAAVVIFVSVNRGSDDDGSDSPKRTLTGKKKPYLVQKKAAASAVKYNLPASNGRKAKGVPHRFAAASKDGVFRDSDGRPYPSADQKIMAAAAAAIENDDLEAARRIAALALNSGNKELREAVVDALGWFGAPAMAELTPFMADPDDGVADAAASHRKDALQEIDDDGTKAGVIEVSAKAIMNKDILEDVANELIGIDEVAAVQVVVNMIESGGDKADVALDVYNSITGEDWSDIDAAETWLQENYDFDDEDNE